MVEFFKLSTLIDVIEHRTSTEKCVSKSLYQQQEYREFAETTTISIKVLKLLHEVLSVHELLVVSSYHKFITFQEHSLYAAHCIISILLTEYCDRDYLSSSFSLPPFYLSLSFSWFCCSNNSTPVFDFSGRLSKPTDAQLLKAFFS